MKLRTLIVTALVAALAVPLFATAHPRGERDGKPNAERRAKFHKKMKERRAKLLRDKLQLPESRAAQVEKALDAFRAKRKPLRKAMHQHHKTLRKLLKDDSNDQQAYTKVLADLMSTRKQLKALQDAQIEGLRQLLTPKQQAQMMVAHHKMRRHMMRRHMRRGGKKGWRQGRGHHGHRGHHGPDGGPERGLQADEGDFPPPAGEPR